MSAWDDRDKGPSRNEAQWRTKFSLLPRVLRSDDGEIEIIFMRKIKFREFYFLGRGYVEYKHNIKESG